ncbi:hypothetical protein [Nostoc sp. UHCC 0251]|uniref:hypothetical protein n=1 Tax=Nostoc sp. UHCC 0251 TaxID=3110240 RepID=UPI002B2100AE|nr:hypothetical protein [Nostoc sp. UHCC 0251]MEA5622942.1 hypothetical protein [Nostoc sp. UHCC 0251]
MFYEKNVIRITYANKSLHLFSENRFYGKINGKTAVRLTDKLFSQLAKNMNAGLRQTELFDEKGSGKWGE